MGYVCLPLTISVIVCNFVNILLVCFPRLSQVRARVSDCCALIGSCLPVDLTLSYLYAACGLTPEPTAFRCIEIISVIYISDPDFLVIFGCTLLCKPINRSPLALWLSLETLFRRIGNFKLWSCFWFMFCLSYKFFSCALQSFLRSSSYTPNIWRECMFSSPGGH